jgi:zinc transporter ZupT
MNQSLRTGLSVAISVWCDNCPQELGDFALFFRAGMTPFQSLLKIERLKREISII